MVNQKNIIDFNSKRPSTTNDNLVAVPQLVTSAQRTAKHYLKKLLPDFFSQIDNSLFDLADKAENNQLQTLYFDAMREIRLQHDLMQDIYFSALDSGFKLSLSQAVINKSQIQLDAKTATQVVQAKKAVMRSLVKKCENFVKKQASIILEEAHTQTKQTLQKEIDRLQALSQVNPNVRKEEIEFFEKQLEALSQVIEMASPRLDALRAIVVM